MVGGTEFAGGGGGVTGAGCTEGRALVTKSCDEAGSDRRHRPMCARWRSSAAIAAAVTASIICCKEGDDSVPEAFAMLGVATHGGGRCSRCLNIRGGNGGASLPLRSAA